MGTTRAHGRMDACRLRHDSLVATIGILAMLGACTAVNTSTREGTGPDTIRIEGVATYRERVALPPGATLEVMVEDVSRIDVPAPVIARVATPARTAPIPFAVEYPASQLKPGHRYAVRARIAHQGRMLFTTDTHNDLPPASTTPLELRLVRASSAPRATVQIEDTYWKLLRLGEEEVAPAGQQREPHLILQAPPDGPKRLAGFAGCNRLVGSYTLDGNRLSFSRLTGTMMACSQGMDLERSFLQALQKVTRWSIRDEQLELFDAAGRRVALLESSDGREQ